ncbi:MAG TPA: AI-2E family transporter [Aliidongia sp.]|nr:AI-2E family transporter [Aliidongia sp.]
MPETASNFPRADATALAAQIGAPVSERPSHQMTLSVAVVVVAALYFGRDILMPLTMAVLLSILLAPLVSVLRRIRMGRVPSVLLAVLFAVGIIVAAGGVIGTQLADLMEDVPSYARTVRDKVAAVRGYALGEIGHVAGSLGYDIAPPEPAPPVPATAPTRRGAAPSSPPPPLGALPGEPQKPIPVEVHQPDPTPFELAERYLSPVLSPIGTAGIVFIVTIFILLQQDDLRDRLIRLFGSSDLRRTTVALDDGGRRLSRYFVTQLAINAGFGAVIAIGLFLIGLPSPVLWGVLGALLRFVPYIGAPVSALFSMGLAAAIDPGWSKALWVFGLYLVVEGSIGQLIEPLVYGRSTGLSPVSVIVAAIFWSWLWGPLGLILSTPLTLCLLVLGRHVDRLEFLDVLLGDTPALTPIESFYQRMLSGDQDEARYYAEQVLKERSLLSFYDEVALPGLELAAIDARRGLLNLQQLERVKETITELVADLDDYEDRAAAPKLAVTKEAIVTRDERMLPEPALPEPGVLDKSVLPASWQTEAPVLCVAGRGPLDEAAASMLCQLLSKHGIGARIAHYDQASRGNINLLDIEGVEMVCVSYLDITGKQAHLKYLLQRLRHRIPAAPLLVGLWPARDPVLRDRQAQALLGADIYARTLAEAVAACLRMATAEQPSVAAAS